MNAKLLRALKVAEAFIADELECRENSMLPGDDEYILPAKAALETVREAIKEAELAL